MFWNICDDYYIQFIVSIIDYTKLLTSSYNIKQKQLVSHHHHKYQDIS